MHFLVSIMTIPFFAYPIAAVLSHPHWGAVGKAIVVPHVQTSPGYILLFVLSIGLLFRAAIGPAESLLIMAGQQGICAAVYTATFVFNVVLNFTLIPRYGLMGAAIATVHPVSDFVIPEMLEKHLWWQAKTP